MNEEDQDVALKTSTNHNVQAALDMWVASQNVPHVFMTEQTHCLCLSRGLAYILQLSQSREWKLSFTLVSMFICVLVMTPGYLFSPL